jgi:polar amino acid transport system substrate-binding protein
MILEDTADAMIADMPICVLTVLRNPNKDLATPSAPLSVEPIGVVLSIEDQRFQNLVDTYIHTLEMTGILEELRKKWLEDSSWVLEVR